MTTRVFEKQIVENNEINKKFLNSLSIGFIVEIIVFDNDFQQILKNP